MEFGRTRVLCAASVAEGVPRWRKGTGSGWVTAEYSMLPRATTTRGDRESVKGKMGGRIHEISRRAGRLAARARAGRLVLTHLPPWTDPDTVRAEAARAYDGPIDLAHPGQNWDI